MKAHINVYTSGIGYSGWDIDLGFTVLPKNQIKCKLVSTMNDWFIKGKNVYYRSNKYSKIEKSHIVSIFFSK